MSTFLIQSLAILASSAWRIWETTGSQTAVKNALRCEDEMRVYLSKQSRIMWG